MYREQTGTLHTLRNVKGQTGISHSRNITHIKECTGDRQEYPTDETLHMTDITSFSLTRCNTSEVKGKVQVHTKPVSVQVFIKPVFSTGVY